MSEPRKVRVPIRERNKSENPSNRSKDSSTSPVKEERRKENPVEVEKVDNNDSKIETVVPQNDSEKSTLSLLNIAALVLGILFFVLLIIFFISQVVEDSGIPGEMINITDSISDVTHQNDSSIIITLIENPLCEFCQVDELEEDLVNLFSSIDINGSENISIEVERIEFNSSRALEVYSSLEQRNLDFDYTPLALVSRNVLELELLQEQGVRNLFVEVLQEDFLVLSPQITQIKFLNSPLEVPQNTITLGNPDGVPILFMFDYNCQRCQVLNGDDVLISQFINEGRITQNYSAPIPQLLVALLDVQERVEDLSFNLQMIPAPTGPQSELSHRAMYCAHSQNQFILMHVELVQIGTNIITQEEEMVSLAASLGLDSVQFQNCLNSQETTNFIQETQQFLVDYGVTSLPITVVGNYPIAELIDSQIVSIFLESELPRFIENIDELRNQNQGEIFTEN